jgi:PPOX class probable F420-dependent enzyme
VDADEARSRFAAARVARLATVTRDGRPHIVPVTFVVEGETIHIAVDDVKPKATMRLARLRNIEANPAVALVVDHYDDDWSALWWARADGRARVVAAESDDARRAVELLATRYPQYADAPPPGPVIVVAVERWAGWSAAG